MTARDVLMLAAEHIARHGWIQHDYEDGSATCALGAIMAVPKITSTVSAVLRLANHLGFEIRQSYSRVEALIENWNDAPERTAAEVIAALRAAAGETP